MTRNRLPLYIFFSLLSLSAPVLAQTEDEILEQADVEELTEEAYSRIMERLADSHAGGRHSLVVRYDQCLNRREGYRHVTQSRRDQSKAYLGDPSHQTIRYNYRQDAASGTNWRAGLVLDKGAGERWSYKPPFADSFSLYAAFSKGSGWLRQGLVGRYRLRMGSGLLCNQQFSLGKNIYAATFFNRSAYLSPHTSAFEDGFMQGAALRLRLGKHWEVIPFVSLRQLDGSLTGDTLTSWTTDGNHRTQKEVNKRNNAWMTNAGISARWMDEWYEVSVNMLYTQFDKTFYRPICTYNKHYFRGHKLLQSSVDYEVRWLGFHLKGETAIDDSQGWATVNGLHRTVFDAWSIAAFYRQYSNSYRQLLASSISESSSMQGERGASLLLSGPLSAYWTLDIAAERFQFTKAQYGINQASEGYETTARIHYDKEEESTYKGKNGKEKASTQTLAFSLRYRLKAKYKNNTQTSTPNDLTPYYRHAVDARLNWNARTGLLLKTQMHVKVYRTGLKSQADTGLAISQTAGWRRTDFPLQAEIQGTWFKAEDYNCRIYLSEKSVLYGFGLPMLYGKGFRLSCCVVYKLNRHLALDAKYARTSYSGASTISSGLQQIRGSHQDNLWVQLRVSL